MSFLRAVRVIRSQWWVIVVVALLGAGLALGAAEWRNRNLEPVFRATAALTVLKLPDEDDDRFERRVETVVAQARSTIADRLSGPNLRVEEGEGGGAVDFVASAPTSDAAMAAAVAMRAAYLESRPAGTAEDQLAPALDSLLAEIVLVESELAELRSASSADPLLETERTALSSRLVSATEEQLALEAQLLDPDLTEEERLEAEGRLETLGNLVGIIRGRLNELPPSDLGAADTETRMRIRVLEQRLVDLEARYVATALRERESGGEGLVREPFVLDESPQEFSVLLGALVGALAGALVGAVGVIASDRVNQPVRSAEDVRGMTVIPIRRRPGRSTGGFHWYRTAVGDPRRGDVQALRASVDRVVERGGVVVIGGIERGIRDAADIARDLAASMAATGRAVLFIDTLFASNGQSSDIGATLAEILEQAAGSPDRSIVKQLLWDRTEQAPGLFVVAAGSPTSDPIDSLAGPAYAALIEEARHTVDAVVISTGGLGTPTSAAVVTLSSLAVIAIEKDRTRESELRDVAARVRELGAPAVMGALVEARSHLRRRGTRRAGRSRTRRHEKA